ncbi:nuclear transport factor 2-like [Triticum aestivum]|uniref:nuclear transport factor 2-like n=1 Tax=Triticum aestivum TaxID=4565 RepID=UPI001D01D6D4|nr:nuclear transport factor 2-like [Triticum aestivum]
MATHADPRLYPTVEVICAVFVDQYYHVLHETPNQAYKFYHDRSTIGRARSDGVVEYVTTLPEINKTLISMDFGKYLMEIETADAMSSHNGGMLIVVTGSLTMVDDVCQNFTQSFFLAPQEGGGYFVLNDIFRIMYKTSRLAITQSDSQENEIKSNVGSILESREAECMKDDVTVENKLADLEVLNPSAGTTYENYDYTEPLVEVTREDLEGIHDAFPPPPQPRKDATSSSYASIVTSLFSRLRNVRG